MNNQVFPHYVSLSQVVLAGYPMSHSPNYLISQNALHHLQCERDRLWQVTSSIVDISNFIFVQFDIELTIMMSFTEVMYIRDARYILSVLVKHSGSHFSCAVSVIHWWIYIDDLNNRCVRFGTTEMFVQDFANGWFFGVYAAS